MSTFFNDSDDSDEERKGKQRINLQSIQATAQKAQTTGETPSKQATLDDNSAQQSLSTDFLTEENELHELRQSSVYKLYAAKSKRKSSPEQAQHPLIDSPTGSLSPSAAAEVRTEPPRQFSTVDVDATDKLTTRDVASHAAEPLPHHDTSLHPTVEPATHPQFMAKSKQSLSRIDPKIIDDSSDDNSDASDSSDEQDAPLGPLLPPSPPVESLDYLPIHNEATLGAHHDSYISSISLEPSGNRLITASFDGTAKLWDFNAMTRALLPFCTVTPLQDASIRTVAFSPTGSHLLFAGGSPSVSITTRDSTPCLHTPKGDMYLVDKALTNGHTAAILSALWHPPGNPQPSAAIATTSADSTLRLWDVANPRRAPFSKTPAAVQVRVTKLRTSRGGRAVASAMAWHPHGRRLALGCTDGRIRIFDPSSHVTRPCNESASPFAPVGTEVTGIACAPSSAPAPLIAVRADDETLRIFDERKLTSAVATFSQLPNTVSETGATFVGNTGSFLLTGTSQTRDSSAASLRLFSLKTLHEAWRGNASDNSGSVVSVLWHKGLNQVVYGTGDGGVHMMYQGSSGDRGILRSLTRSDVRKRQGVASISAGEAMPASALFARMGSGSKRGAKRGRIETDDTPKPRPVLAVANPPLKSTTMAKHLDAKTIDKNWSADPREAILKYAKRAEEEPMFTNASKKTNEKTNE